MFTWLAFYQVKKINSEYQMVTSLIISTSHAIQFIYF